MTWGLWGIGVPVRLSAHFDTDSDRKYEPDLYLHPSEIWQYANPDNGFKRFTFPEFKQTVSSEGAIHEPVEVSTDGKYAYLTDGHHRVQAADELGLDRVPVRVIHRDGFQPGDPEVGGSLRAWLDERHHTAHRTAMPAPMPQGITFHYHPIDDTIPVQPWAADPTVQTTLFSAPAVEARHHGKTVGFLEWDPPLHSTQINGIAYGDHPPEVSMIKVHPDYRRHGIATALFDFARQHQGDLEHSDSRTGLGNRWVEYEQNRHRTAHRTAALDSDLANRLHDEFHDWYDREGNPTPSLNWAGTGDRGPLGYWPNVEDFLKARYPAAHKNFLKGMEDAGDVLDHPEDHQDYEGRVYETGPEAVTQYGYDPAEIAAGMLLLHNQTHPYRWGDHQQDLDRLTDIVTKRNRMQQQRDNPTPGLLDGYDTSKIPWHVQDMLHKNQNLLRRHPETLRTYLQINHPESVHPMTGKREP